MNQHILKKLYLTLFFLLALVQLAQASPSHYYYKQLSIKEGLSQSRVQSILKDYKGYLWIGTKWGLNSYDGENIKQYFHEQNNASSIPSNNITFIAEDSLKNLWIATSKGICLYNRAKDTFDPIIHNKKNLYIASYLLLNDGILLAGAGSLFKYDYDSKQLITLYTATNSSEYTPFLEMIKYNNDRVLLNTQRHGIYSYQLSNGEIKKLNYLTGENYTSIFLDSDSRLWVSDYGNGLYCYKDEILIKNFTSSNSPLTYPVIHDMIQKDNMLWIATDGGGINIISLENFSFTTISHTQDDMSSFPANTIYRLYKDDSNNVWAGTVRNGLIGIKEVYARSFQNVPFGNKNGLSHQSTNSFFEDKNGIIWIGTDGGGINSFNPESNIFKHHKSTKNEKVVSIIEYSPNQLLYFSFNKGFFIYNKLTEQTKPFIIMNESMNEKTCISGFSVHTHKIAEDKIIFSSQNIFLYDINKDEFSIIATKGEDYERNSPLIIATIGTKTYFADLSKILEYDASTNQFTSIYSSNYIISDASIDNNGVFWLATTQGLVSYNPIKKEKKLIETDLFTNAVSVIADNKNRIWIGTHHKLYVYNSLDNRYSILEETDGVLANEYINNATVLTKNNSILMGGTNGMTIIDSDIEFEVTENFQIEVLDVLLNGLPIPFENNLESIKAPWNFSSLQLKVILNEKDIFRKNIFNFQIEGLNQGKMIHSTTNSFLISHLPIGEYSITSSYYTKDGTWSPNQKILNIKILPPWWRTRWSYASIVLFVILLILAFLNWIYKRRKAQKQREAIELKNKIYEERIRFLTNISHELRTPLTLVTAPLKRIIDNTTTTKEVNTQLRPIYRQASKMKGVIDMVLDMRKLEEGKSPLNIKHHNLNEWIKDVADEFASEFKAKGIRIIYKLDEDIEKAPFDKSKCKFVLSNFIMNALKFSHLNSVVKIITTFTSDKKWVRIAIKDQGIGLDDVEIDSLFMDFYQGENAIGGTGIGLSYAKSLIKEHNGNIGANANSDKGATFYFELPLLPSKEVTADNYSEKAAEIITHETTNIDYEFLKTYSVIVVEDTLDLRVFLKDTLSTYFEKVYTAKDGKEGLELILQKLPDIIISDVSMPNMSGFDLCKAVKTNLDISHIPVILLTAYHNPKNMYTGYKIGADAFLAKPFEIEGLLNLVNNQLMLRENIKSRYQRNKKLTLKEMSFSNADETFLLNLNKLIEENLNNTELNVDFIVKELFMSRSLLYEKIKALTGMSIIEYLNKYRIDKAALLLSTTSNNITEISEMVGFSSPRYFSRVFKSSKGLTPTEFKNKKAKS